MSTVDEAYAGAHDDVRDIEALLSRFTDAVRDADIGAIRSVWCEDAVSVFTGSAGRVRGAADITEVWARHVGSWSDVLLERSDTLVRIHGDTAWAAFVWTGSGVADGDRYEVAGERWTVVLLWEEGAWRFAQTHSSLPVTDWKTLKAEP